MIVDKYGNTITTVATKSYRLPQDFENRATIKRMDKNWMDLVDKKRHQELISSSRTIVSTFSEVDFAIRQKAELSCNFTPKFRGKDKNWGKEVTEFLDYYLDSDFDVRGMPWTYQKDLELISRLLDIDGDVFYITTKQGENPCIQFIEAPSVGNRNSTIEKIKTGRYEGSILKNGIIYNRYGREVAYQVLSDDGITARILPAGAMRRIADPSWFSEGRGVTSLASCVLDWIDIRETREAEKIGQKVNSRITLLHKNDNGLPGDFLPVGGGTTGEEGNTVETEIINDGQMMYIKSSGDISAHESNRPSANWMNFDKMIRQGAFAGMGWRIEMLDPSQLGSGAPARSVMDQVNRTIKKRWEVIYPYAKHMIDHIVSMAIESGLIPDSEEWNKWGFNKPKELTVDEGRMRDADRADLRAGLTSPQRLLEKNNTDMEEIHNELEEWIMDVKERAEKLGWNPAEFGVWGNPGDTAAVMDNETISNLAKATKTDEPTEI